MPRPRKSRLLPSIATVCEELVRLVGEQIDRAIEAQRTQMTDELRAMRREMAQLARRVGRAPARETGRVGRPRSDRVCSVKGCEQPHVARGLCKNHYQQMRYLEKKAASGQTVRRRRSSGALGPILEAAKSHPVVAEN